jgi:hypothetical protein
MHLPPGLRLCFDVGWAIASDPCVHSQLVSHLAPEELIYRHVELASCRLVNTGVSYGTDARRYMHL